MNPSESQAPKAERRSKQDVLCAKCDHPNPYRANKCENCGAHLYVSCHACGLSNPRSRSRCVQCGHRLHRSAWSKIEKNLFRGKFRSVKPAHIILLVVVVFITYRVIVRLAD
ncbi:MAG TPA: zinc ribbon domain-containing protein, partial [Verrucomicrobiae bacterium]|nr:zinc ribbon domain-containing protein [Verrucomicrobiae bacterium]